MYNFKYKMSSPAQWHNDMEKQIPITIKDSTFLLKSNFGKGGGTYQMLQPGLWIEQINFKLKEFLSVEVIPKPSNDFFQITFWTSASQIVQKLNEEQYHLNIENVSVVLISSMINTIYEFPGENKGINLFMIWISKDWMSQNTFGPKALELRKILEKDEPIYFSENMDYKFKNLLKELDFENANKLNLLTNTLQLLSHFFSNLEKQNVNNIATLNIHHSDIKQLMYVRNHIQAHPLQDISIEALSNMANMSLSKFKRLFKKLFGTTPYRYCLKNKMEIAKETLQQKEYTVSQTGFMVGYSNLSQFSKAFKNHFGYLPSEIRA